MTKIIITSNIWPWRLLTNLERNRQGASPPVNAASSFSNQGTGAPSSRSWDRLDNAQGLSQHIFRKEQIKMENRVHPKLVREYYFVKFLLICMCILDCDENCSSYCETHLIKRNQEPLASAPTAHMQATPRHLEPQRHAFPSEADITTAWELEGDEKAKQNKISAVNIHILSCYNICLIRKLILLPRQRNNSFINKVQFYLNEVGLRLDVSIIAQCIYSKGNGKQVQFLNQKDYLKLLQRDCPELLRNLVTGGLTE